MARRAQLNRIAAAATRLAATRTDLRTELQALPAAAQRTPAQRRRAGEIRMLRDMITVILGDDDTADA
jgi:hypothetical protein